DWALEHTFTNALIELDDAKQLRTYLDEQKTWKPGQYRAVLMALENLAPDELKASEVMELLVDEEAKSKAAAVWIIGRHPAWGAEVAKELQDKPIRLDPASLEMLLRPLVDSAEVQMLVSEWLGDKERRSTAAHVVAQSRLKNVPDAWVEKLSLLLAH